MNATDYESRPTGLRETSLITNAPRSDNYTACDDIN